MSVETTMKYFSQGINNNHDYLYTIEEKEQYEDYICKTYGDYTNVYREIVHPKNNVHLDILIVPPNEKENYYKLITRGAGAYKMNIPEMYKDYELERAELVMFLPPDWDMNFGKEENGWVISLIKRIGRLSIEENSWIAPGHTLSHNDIDSYAKNTKLSSALLLDAVDEKGNPLELRLDGKGKINFYQILPLYKEELEYKMKNGTSKLMDLLEGESLVLNINRKNYCENLKDNIKKDEIDIEMELD